MAGISDAALSYIENGLNNAKVGTLQRIAKALGVSVSDLFKEPSRKRRPA